MDKENQINRLICAYLRNEISTEEWNVLQEWIYAKESHKLLFEELLEDEKRQRDIQEYASFHTQEQWLELKQKITECHRQKYRILKYKGIAAAITIILATAVTLIYLQEVHRPVKTQLEIVQIVPGHPQAVLIGENGKQITLRERQSQGRQFIFGADTLEITKDNSLKYEPRPISQTEWHTLQIPKGGEFKLVLEDGTTIWLNSETELKYPSHFAGNERRVQLSGEAYFEVVSNPQQPFIVSTLQMDTKVLGTSFNVSAYPDENKSHTTLIEGSVEINDKENGESVCLKPGEQALLQDRQLKVVSVNTKLYSQWRKDRFTFSSTNMEEVVRKLSRWYDVEFFFSNSSTKEKQFTGSLPKYSEISQVLNIIEMTTNIKFQIKNKTIIIQ